MVISPVSRLAGRCIAAVASLALLLPSIAPAQSGAARKVVAVVAIDSYGDLKQQLT